MAVELLNLYAARKAVEGHAFGPDMQWQSDFESAFPYEMTIDQQIAVNDIKRDLEFYRSLLDQLAGRKLAVLRYCENRRPFSEFARETI